MSEFITKHEADQHYGKKGTANAGLTLGIIGTALGAGLLSGNGILGGNGIFGGNASATNGNGVNGPTA